MLIVQLGWLQRGGVARGASSTSTDGWHLTREGSAPTRSFWTLNGPGAGPEFNSEQPSTHPFHVTPEKGLQHLTL